MAAWNVPFSNPKLKFSSDLKEVSRSDHFEFFPVAFTLPCASWTCLGTFHIQYEGEMHDFSIGVLVNQEYACDQNLMDCIGQMSNSWGWSQGAGQTSAIWSQGKCVFQSRQRIKSNDRISIYLDLNEGDDGGYLVFYHNEQPVHRIDGLLCDVQFVMACTMSPSSTVSILLDNKYRDIMLRSSPLLGSLESEQPNDDDNDNDNEDVPLPSSPRALSGSVRVIESSFRFSADQAPSPSPINSFNVNHADAGVTEVSTSEEVSITRNAPLPVPSFFPQRPLLESSTRASSHSSSQDPNSEVKPSGMTECCVCLSLPRRVVFMPCKHLCTCETCGMANQLVHCPMCRQRIKSRMQVYI
eukprot:scaffold487_cov178-Ochromonas_danica.AAC.22